MLNNGTHIELKNKSYTENTTPTTQEIDQVIGQNGAFGNISSLEEYEWVAFANRGNDAESLKTMWKNTFSNTDPSLGPTTSQIYNNMSDELKQSLNLTGLNAQSSFNQLVNDSSSSLYEFIKAQ